jgi:hypothetical protein
MRAPTAATLGLLALVSSACSGDSKSEPCDGDTATVVVGAGTPATYVEGTARCDGTAIDPTLSANGGLGIGVFSGWEAAWDVPGTVVGYHTGLYLVVSSWPLNTPLSPSIGRYWSDASGCHDGVLSGTITFTAVGPVGGRVTGSFSNVILSPSSNNVCARHTAAGTDAVALSGTFSVTRTQ